MTEKAIEWLEGSFSERQRPAENYTPAMFDIRHDTPHEYAGDAAVWRADGKPVLVMPGSFEAFKFAVTYPWTLLEEKDHDRENGS